MSACRYCRPMTATGSSVACSTRAATFRLQQSHFSTGDQQALRRMTNNSAGIVLLTGPTGSGKTSTLYALLAELNTVDFNIMTIEDPVEYVLPGISQVQVNEKQGLSFADTLRSILRQDPDVVLVGEIRDGENGAHRRASGADRPSRPVHPAYQ